MHATARWSVNYGRDLSFAGTDLPRPAQRSVPTRHGKVPVHIYTDPAWPRDESRGVYVHFHGGAWLMRYPQMDDFWCRYVAATAGVAVVNVDFRTGPYVAYPVAQEQGHDVAAWLSDHAGEVSRHAHLDPGRLAIGGFSSGGGIAASVCLQARDAGSFVPRLQVLGVPALDLASDLPAGPGMISPQLRGLVRRVYFPDVERRAEPYASPVLAEDLTGLPPAVILTAERDTLRPDGERYAQRLRAAGVPVVYDMTPDAEHYWLTSDLLRARDTMAMMAREIAASLTLES